MTGKPTIYDVAAAAHVSHQTLSRVLNGSDRVRPSTRKQVEAAITALQYQRDDHAAALVRRRRTAPSSVPGATGRTAEQSGGQVLPSSAPWARRFLRSQCATNRPSGRFSCARESGRDPRNRAHGPCPHCLCGRLRPRGALHRDRDPTRVADPERPGCASRRSGAAGWSSSRDVDPRRLPDADRVAGLPLGWDARNGVVQRRARAHGIPTPVSDVVVPLLAAASDGPG